MFPPTSEQAYVWVFLPGQVAPVVAGVASPARSVRGLTFQYADSYRARGNAISLGPDLPLLNSERRVFAPEAGWGMPLTLRDAMPDSWGERVAQHATGLDSETELAPVQLMLSTGSNRIGALDFQQSPTEYVPRGGAASLEELAEGALIVQQDDGLSTELRQAIRNTMTTPGGAQPKALVELDGVQYLAKFPVRSDSEPIIKAEAMAIHLASAAGITVPAHRLVDIEGHGGVLLTERFDRGPGGVRRQVISGFTIVRERWTRGSYPDLARKLGEMGMKDAGERVFRRVAFNMAIRSDDDHLRNMSAFWDGASAELTPAYDLAPYMGSGSSQSQTSISASGDRSFTWAALTSHAAEYSIPKSRALEITQQLEHDIQLALDAAVDQARLTHIESRLARGAVLRKEITATRRIHTGAKPSGRSETQLRRGGLGLGKTPAGGSGGSFAACERAAATPPPVPPQSES